jgi:hypothetical protein
MNAAGDLVSCRVVECPCNEVLPLNAAATGNDAIIQKNLLLNNFIFENF